MDSHIYRKAAFRLPALADIAVLRFNTRGTWSVQGTQRGEFDNAVGERYDVAAALEYAEFHDLPNIWLRGLVVRHRPGAHARPRPGRAGVILLSRRCGTASGAPRGLGRVREAGHRAGAGARRLPPAARGEERFTAIPQAEVVPSREQAPLGRGRRDGARRDRERVAPEVATPLPTEWDGRWRPPTPAPTTRTTSPHTRTCPCQNRETTNLFRFSQLMARRAR